MDDFDIAGEHESSTALYTVSALPFDAASPVVFHYPAMKLGVRANVHFLAQQLGNVARELHAREVGFDRWVIASPPYFVLPGAANLMAREIHRGMTSPGSRAPVLAEMPLAPLNSQTDAHERTELYSQARFDARVKERGQIHQRLLPLDPHAFEGRAVLFVNDINVTGAQQHFMRKAMRAAGAVSIHWLYLVKVPPEVGRAHPQLEYELNYSRLSSFEEFGAIVSGEGIDFTARCVNRLFDYEDAQLETLFRAMPVARRSHLLRLATDEARFQGRSEAHWERLSRMETWVA
jgi:hypothetical protein